MPSRLPSNVKRLRGTLRPHRERSDAPALEPCAVPPPPRGMPSAEAAIWRRLAGEVEALGVYDVAAGTAFRLLHSLTCAVELADPADPPTARARAAQAAQTALAAWGLTPASRGKVHVAPAQPEASDPLGEFRTPPRGVA